MLRNYSLIFASFKPLMSNYVLRIPWPVCVDKNLTWAEIEYGRLFIQNEYNHIILAFKNTQIYNYCFINIHG